MAETAAGEPWIALADDGVGMSEVELIDAMRLGSKNPTHKRIAEDLGRFGLGLKSASFSQCRRLTVLTRQNNKIACARWDLDEISKRNDWSLELIDDTSCLNGRELLPETGTVVVWENLDRLNGGYGQDQAKQTAHINSELSRAERHLKLVFHRFLQRTNQQLKLTLNGRSLESVDPFASSHAATQKDPEELLRLQQGDVSIRCYTLPHHKRMTQEQWSEVGGPEGHLKSQGLYIYREKRLIIAGGWLGLARQTELTKLCRIAVDIPNTMDSEWKIDVKKASAQLPPVVRERLKKVVERFIGTSKQTYRKRGHRLVDETRFPIWNRVRKNGQIVFRPNLEHPIFRAYYDQLSEEFREGFERCMRILGSGLPIETLHAELVGNAEAVTVDETSAADLEELVHSLAVTLVENGVPSGSLSETLQSNPFLRSRWEAVAPILEDFLRTRIS